jgi:hypothetical protein
MQVIISDQYLESIVASSLRKSFVCGIPSSYHLEIGPLKRMIIARWDSIFLTRLMLGQQGYGLGLKLQQVVRAFGSSVTSYRVL